MAEKMRAENMSLMEELFRLQPGDELTRLVRGLVLGTRLCCRRK